MARILHTDLRFDLAHQVSFCGYREPGYLWQLGVPFVWGPVGGTHNFPLRYLSELSAWDACCELGRNVANAWHLRYRSRVRQAASSCAHLFAANTTTQRDFLAIHGLHAELQLETGLASLPEPWQPRERPSGRPLRVLWAGRHCGWKGFPLLLRALKENRSRLDFELRVVGYGPRERAHRALVERMALQDRVTFVGWPPYRDSLSEYAWADVFAFTSLRDTSGTGLLEALAHGCPILAVNHQGAADIVNEKSGLLLSTQGPARTVAELGDGLWRMATDPDLLPRLSRGARERAERYLWAHLGARMRAVYWSVLEDANNKTVASNSPSLATSPLTSGTR